MSKFGESIRSMSKYIIAGIETVFIAGIVVVSILVGIAVVVGYGFLYN